MNVPLNACGYNCICTCGSQFISPSKRAVTCPRCWESLKQGSVVASAALATAHWAADCLTPDDWQDNPTTSPELAARAFLELTGTENDDCWDAWNELEKCGSVKIKVRRWDRTTEIITDPDEQFDGYEPGGEWFKKAAEVVEVMVSLGFQVLASVKS